MNFKNQAGYISLVAIIAIAIVVSSIIGASAYQTIKKQAALKPSPTPKSTSTPTPKPTPSPTQTPTPKPTITPTPKPSATAVPTISTPPSSGYARLNIATDRGNFNVDVVTVDSASSQMITDTANTDNCTDNCPTLSLGDFVARNGGFAGINGSYFCPDSYPDCQSKKNSYDFPVYNSGLHKWLNEGNLSWNGRSMVYRDGSGMHYKQNARDFGGGLEAGITNYPGILDGGHITVDAPSLSEKQSSKGTKGGIGLNGTKVYLAIAYNVDMYDFAQVFKAMGATHAMNLDGGGSAALYYNDYKVGPGRNLPNAIIFK